MVNLIGPYQYEYPLIQGVYFSEYSPLKTQTQTYGQGTQALPASRIAHARSGYAPARPDLQAAATRLKRFVRVAPPQAGLRTQGQLGF